MISKHDNAFRIAIVGGGLGGLFTALCIHHHCKAIDVPVKIDVYEQAAQYKEIGAGLGLGLNAAKLAHAIGIGDKLNAISGLEEGIHSWLVFRRFDNSEDVVNLDVLEVGKIRQAPCVRTELLDLFKSTIEERGAATLHTKKACSKVEALGPSVQIHFGDSSRAEADLVIAADGFHSAIRNQFVVDEAIFSGFVAYRGINSANSLKDWPFEYAGAWVAKHKHFLIYPIGANKLINVVAFVTTAEQQVHDVRESWTSECERTEMESDFADFDKPVQDIIAHLPKKVAKWRINDRATLDQWHFLDGKVILLGEAAHPMVPHLGAGASQAMEDAWVLGRAISDYLSSFESPHFRSLSTMADLYQQVRVPRAHKAQIISRAAGNTYELQSEGMIDKSFEKCLPMLKKLTEERLKFVWEPELDTLYENARDGENRESPAKKDVLNDHVRA